MVSQYTELFSNNTDVVSNYRYRWPPLADNINSPVGRIWHGKTVRLNADVLRLYYFGHFLKTIRTCTTKTMVIIHYLIYRVRFSQRKRNFFYTLPIQHDQPQQTVGRKIRV